MPVHGDEPVQHLHEVITGDGAFNLDRQRGFGELISNRENLQYPPVGGLVEREISRPHMVGELRVQPVPGSGGGPDAGAFAARNPHA